MNYHTFIYSIFSGSVKYVESAMSKLLRSSQYRTTRMSHKSVRSICKTVAAFYDGIFLSNIQTKSIHHRNMNKLTTSGKVCIFLIKTQATD